MADYPDWVMKHKRKGTYINKAGNKYYLYAAHSERVPGTKKVVRVSDGYLGRVTEKDGFIPAKRKLSGEVFVYEYGFSHTILALCGRIHSGLRREFKANADFVMASGALLFMYGEIRQETYETSWLLMSLPGLSMDTAPTGKQRAGIERTGRMIADTLKKRFGDELPEAFALLPCIRMVCMAGDHRAAAIPPGAAAFCERHRIVFKEDKENGE
ncbi:MAG: hypothetical protein LBS85_02615 [Clostridiales Family XIII bacterium]|nr:hypothetical protein [Clostridiales Family XIII bacterium]